MLTKEKRLGLGPGVYLMNSVFLEPADWLRGGLAYLVWRISVAGCKAGPVFQPQRFTSGIIRH